MPDLTILHTNDFHNRLTEAGASLLREAKSRHDALLLDAGDAISAGNVYFRPGGEPILDLMAGAGYDAMTVGNREFHFTGTGFRSKLSRAPFAVLCANVRPQGDAIAPCLGSIVLEKVGIKVGLFGVSVPMVKAQTRAARFSAFVFDDPLAVAAEKAAELRPQCDVLIALTHIGLTQDRLLAERAPEIGLIIGGHSHDRLDQPLWVNRVPIVQAGSYGREYGLIYLTRRTGCWEVEGSLQPLRDPAR